MNRVLMILMAVGAALGGLDRMIGNKFGLGERFDEGFHLLGSLALSMAGIMCLMPALSGLLERVIAPAFAALGMDPGMFGGILAIDMGGYQLAQSLARDPSVGRFSGIIVGATFGCTAVFSIPVGFSLTPKEAHAALSRGLMLGLMALPAALVTGGLICGLGLLNTIWQCMPILLIAGLLLLGLIRRPDSMVKGFSVLSRVISPIAYAGLTVSAVQYMIGFELIPGMVSLPEAMQVVSSIGIMLLGSLPLSELLQRLLKRPFEALGRRTGMNAAGTTGLLIGLVNVTPALGMMARMDERSRVVNAAALVSGASAFTAHFAFTMSVSPETAGALLAAKIVGAVAAALLALFFTTSGRTARA